MSNLRRLEQLEKQIQSAQLQQIKAAKAMHKIRVEKLYRGTHETFEAFCRDELDMDEEALHEFLAEAAAAEQRNDPE